MNQQFDEPLPAPTDAELLLEQAGFTSPHHVRDLRVAVAEHAAAVGLPHDKAAGFVAAVNEAMNNAVRHGGGGTLRIWRGKDLVCDVCDQGPGFQADAYRSPMPRPQPSPQGGLGLWLARELADDMHISSGPDGTTVRLAATLPNDDQPELL
jgi:anti-sigma regulatory factor (Ser/Thr protein kinase)